MNGGTKSTPWTLTWKNISVTKRRRISTSFWSNTIYETIKILSNVTGGAKSGNLLAIMGASGAGKTTMLATIGCRDRERTNGTLFLNGDSVTSCEMAELSGFSPQHDVFFDELTVFEHMTFMASLKINRRMSAVDRNNTIERLLNQFGILMCSDTRIKFLSGGEKKRISICVELLNDPAILFCDEPTTGLDSWAAISTVKILRQLAESGKLVICTIHQPASGIFDLFHDVALLAHGRVAFHGPSDCSAIFFNSLDLICPVGYNQAEYYISHLSVARGHELECLSRIDRICHEYAQSKYFEAAQGPTTAPVVTDIVHNGDVEKIGWFQELYWLSWRLYIVTMRSIYALAIDFILIMVTAFIVALPYANIAQPRGQKDIQNIEGLVYLTITETVFLHIYQMLTMFPAEISILLREVSNGLYRSTAYYCSKMLFSIPIAFINSMFYTLTIYILAGLGSDVVGFVTFLIPVVVTSVVSSAYGAALSASFEYIETAFLVSVPFELIGLCFSGIFLSIPSASAYVVWLKYISIFYYGIEILSILQWKDVHYIECSNASNVPCTENGAQVLERYGFSEDNLYRDYFGLFLIYALCHFIGAVMIIKRSRRQAVY